LEALSFERMSTELPFFELSSFSPLKQKRYFSYSNFSKFVGLFFFLPFFSVEEMNLF